MIECKQYGKKYNEAKKIILTNDYKKEQLFNYYLNDKNPKYLLLYTSTLSSNNEITYRNDIIDTKPLKNCPTQQDLYDTWDKNFITKAIFEDSIEPYETKNEKLKLLKRNLIEIDYPSLKVDDNEGSIYNLFAEILRRYSVSDKSNAYDKIFNLFLCKIVDEDNASEDEELLFQWKATDTPEDVLGRLNDLYTEGMNEYLKLHVGDVTEKEFKSELKKLLVGSNLDGSKLEKMFHDLRLYRNNAFAFKEIIDERTFRENAEIVKSIILLLQPYKIRYNHKQKYLSDFFERLLNIGIKQESGQFFTPIPIANFICNAIDVENIINKKIENKDNNFLPYVIDYACGSGHFLTEMMDRIDKIVQKIDENTLKTKLQKDNMKGWKTSYKWARDFVYGIEKDYRLAKTTKVATFLNGDGDANIIYANGLDSFSSEQYTGILHSTKKIQQDNPVFDIVIANPPYSVSDFKRLLPNADLDFNIAKQMSNKSDDIECLFVERTKQLLKIGGRAGIILPSTILLTGAHYFRARIIILKYFKIRGIAEFGKLTFALTGQNTVALFLERRENDDYEQAKKCVDMFFKNFTDFTFDRKENIIQEYIKSMGKFEKIKDYIEFIRELNDEKIKTEKRKLIYYLLCFGQTVIVSHYGNSTEEEKEYLGYEHSSMKNYEGIHPYPHNDTGIISTILYSDKKENSVAKLIKNNFESKEINIPSQLRKNVRVENLTDMMDFSDDEFECEISVMPFTNPFNDTIVPMKTIQDYINEGSIHILDFMRQPIKKSKRKTGSIPYYGANGQVDTVDDFIFDETLLLVGEDGARWGSGDPTSIIIHGKSWVNNHAHVLRIDNDVIRIEYLKKIINFYDFSYLKSRPNGGKLLQSQLKKLAIPNLSIKQQENILKKFKSNDLKKLVIEEIEKSY